MKKGTLLLGVIILMSFLAACGSTGSDEAYVGITAESAGSGEAQIAEKTESTASDKASAMEETEAMAELKENTQPVSSPAEPFRTMNGTHNAYYDNVAASDGTDTYYVRKHEIWKLNPDGEDELILGKGDAIANRWSMTGGDGMLFYSFYADGDDSVHCYNTQTGVEASLGIQGGGLFYYDGWLYYKNEGKNCRVRPDGEEIQEIIATDGRFWCLYKDWLYVAHNDGTTVRIHTDGSGEEMIKDKSARGAFPMIVYEEKLICNGNDYEYNTDGEYLYCWVDYGLENGFYRCTDPEQPESGTLLAGISEFLQDGEHVSYVNVAGDYLFLQGSYDSDWYVMRKDGMFVKELGTLD